MSDDEFTQRRLLKNADSIWAESLEAQARVATELQRLGEGIEALRDEWATSHPEHAQALNDLLVNR